MPEHPLISIRPGSRWKAVDLSTLWSYRELLLFLTWRDIKVRYKQTALGAAWALIQPLFTMIIFTIFFGKLAGVKSDGIPYPLFAYAGLLPWIFFSNAITNSGNSLVGNANLITKVYFPRMIIPGAAVAAGLVDLAIAFVLMFILMLYYGTGFFPGLLMLPILIGMTTLLAVGIGMWLSALNVKYRDIRYAIPFAVQLLMFASPIIYPVTMVPERWRWLYRLNPLTPLIEGYRAAFFGGAFEWGALGLAAIISLLIFLAAMIDFKRMERTLADLV
ncbi:MAG: ABC transporter permease [Blastocatellia bacterium]|nr:ABC transporter permease [Blastocatellia bacterium]